MDIIVVGAGAMGSLYGGSLQQAFPDWRVVLVDVWKEHVAAIQEHGLKIDRQGRPEVVNIQACLPRDAATFITEPADLVIVFTKTMFTESALEPVKPLIAGKTTMLTLQNGLGNIEKLEKFVDRDHIIAGVSTNPSNLLGPGSVRMPAQGETKLMTASGKRTPMLEQVEAALTRGGLNCHIAPDVLGIIWEKVAFNACMNGLTCITLMPVGGIAASDEGVSICRAMIAEAAAVAAKKGIAFDEARVWETAEMALAEHKKHMTSMLQDRIAKRRTEVDAIQGGIVRGGEETGVPTPVTGVVYKLIKTIENAYEWADFVKQQSS